MTQLRHLHDVFMLSFITGYLKGAQRTQRGLMSSEVNLLLSVLGEKPVDTGAAPAVEPNPPREVVQ